MKKETRKVTMMGIPVNSLTTDETVELIKDRIKSGKKTVHASLNALKLIEFFKSGQLGDFFKKSDVISADGQLIVMLSAFTEKKLPERVPGCDVMQKLVKTAAKEELKIFFLGSEDEVLSTMVKKYTDKYGSQIIAGCRNGFFEGREAEIVKDIKSSGANILFVALGSPKQEKFIERNSEELFKSVDFIMGVGGSFDIVAGKTRRAPLFFRKKGLEWLYRVLSEPQRIWTKKVYRLPLLFYYFIRYKIRQYRSK
ncbi:MAG: WecB/TagA/CpsF family glycosyltransferase [bacterium]